MLPAKVLQPNSFTRFRCIGDACEDTCCVGWAIHVDKPTYDKYQSCPDPEMLPRLQKLVAINEKSTAGHDFAHIVLSGPGCPFLTQGLCAIQNRLGEGYLSDMCAIYPRVLNRVDSVLQRSLNLSCPEAARVTLLDPSPMTFEELDYPREPIRLGKVPSLDTTGLTTYHDPAAYYRSIRQCAISLLQNRSYPMWKRLFLAGCLCDTMNDPQSLQNFADALSRGTIDGLMNHCPATPEMQLETVLELVVARIASDFNPPRFLECYKQFMTGIQWTSKSTMSQMRAHYEAARDQYYAPFMASHDYMLEHYLVNYAHRTLFPFGLPESNERLKTASVASLFSARYMLMTAYYAITRALLIGLAGFHKSALDPSHVVQLVQSCSKTFEHSSEYPRRVIEMLAKKDMTNPVRLSVLIR